MPLVTTRASVAYGAGFGKVLGGASFTPTGSYDALASYTVGAGGISSVTFGGLPTGGQYRHLQIKVFGKTTDTTAGLITDTYWQYNGDTSANYAQNYLLGNGNGANAVYSTGVSGSTVIRANSSVMGSASAFANMFGVTTIDILDYANPNKLKTSRHFGGSSTGTSATQVDYDMGLWNSLQPISSIKLYPAAGNWAQYTTISVYGIRG